MKRLYLIINLIFCFDIFAQLSISVSPTNPVAGESFEVSFSITTSESAEPFVSFDPSGLEVIGRRQETSIQTQFLNGKITTIRKVRLVYEMVSDKSRVARLRNIKAEVGSETYDHKNISIKIAKTRAAPKDIFVQAEVDNVEPYVGQGVDVRYYLYSRRPLHSTEIKQFPKLNGFIKRFHNVKNNSETVRIGDKLYSRTLQYSARLYPMKSGELKIDSLRLIVRYSNRSSNPFGSFGLTMGRLRERTVSSPVIKLESLDLPSENVPAGFLGLVGKHDVKLNLAKSKFLINEPIEARLELNGPGALEKMNAPVLFQSNALEDFDIKTDFVATDEQNGRKTFDYTYLARADTKIDERTLSIYYFDPEKKVYESVKVQIPALTVGGGAVDGGRTNQFIDQRADAKINSVQPGGETRVNKEVRERGVVAPIFDNAFLNIIRFDFNILFKVILCVFFLIFLETVFYFWRNKSYNSKLQMMMNRLNKKGLNYGDLTRLIFLLGQKNEDPRSLIKHSMLPEEDKQYFLDCLHQLEYSVFSDKRTAKKKVPFNKKAFKTLCNLIENGNIQQNN